MAEYLVALSIICLASLVFFLFVDELGRLLGNSIGTLSPVGNIFYGLLTTVSIAAVGITGCRTIFLFPLCILLFFIWKGGFRKPSFDLRGIFLRNLPFFGLLVINVLIRFFQLYNTKTGTLFTDYTDQYNYIDQINLLLRFGKEVDFLGLESKLFGEAYNYSPYHYFEVYISVLGKWSTGQKAFFVFEFFTLPMLVSLAQVQLIRASNALFSTRIFPAVLWVLVATSCFRFFNFGIVFQILPVLKLHVLDYLTYFPLYAITSEHSLYFYSFIFKVSTFVILFATWYSGWQKKDQNLQLIACLSAPYINLVFLPFFFIISALSIYSGHTKVIRNSLAWTASFLFLGAFYILANRGNAPVPQMPYTFPGFAIDFGIKSLYHWVVNCLLFPFSNYYPLLVLSAGAVWLFNRKPKRLFLFLLVIGFPLIFLSYAVLFKLFLVLLIGLIIWNSIDWLPLIRNDKSLLFSVTALLFLALLNAYLYRFFDFYQVWFMPFVGLVVFFPAIYLSRIKLNTGFIVMLVGFVFHNLTVLGFHYHRISLPGNPKEFTNAFLQKTKGRFTKGVYVSSLPARPYIYIGRTGYDIQNQSDSLYLTFISFDQLSRADTNHLVQIKAWDFYQRFPFVKFYNRHKNKMLLDDAKRLFVKEKDVLCVFRSKGDSRALADFANPFMVDSLYDGKEMSWVYFLDKQRLSQWNPPPK